MLISIHTFIELERQFCTVYHKICNSIYNHCSTNLVALPTTSR